MSGESPALPWKTRIFVAIISAANDTIRSRNGTVNRRLASLIDAKVSPNPSPVKGVRTSDVTVDASRNLWFRLFVPTAGERGDGSKIPVVVFFHGGGFTFLGPDSWAYDAVCRRFARRFPAVVVSVNYRLSPEHKCPSQYDDGFDVLRFIDEGEGILPEFADLGRCFLAGDSAGGNLSHHVAFRSGGGGGGAGGGGATKLGKVRVVGVVSIQPFFGGEERMESEIRLSRAPLVSLGRTDWMWRAFLPEGADRNHPAANVSGPNAAEIGEVAGFPATLVFVGGLDPLQDWQRRYCEWLKRSGKEVKLVEYPNAIHAFYVFPELPEASLLLTEVQKFIHDRPNPPPSVPISPL